MTSITTYPVRLNEGLASLTGCAFGISQSTLLGSLSLNLPPDINVADLADTLADILNINVELTSSQDSRLDYAVTQLLLDSHLSLQRQSKIAVFSPPVIIDMNMASASSPLRQILFATPYARRQASLVTLRVIVNIINNLIQGFPDADQTVQERLKSEVSQARDLLRDYSIIGLNRIHFLAAAHALEMPVSLILNTLSPIIAVGLGTNSRWLNSSLTDNTSPIGSNIASNKYITSRILGGFGLPVPQHKPAGDEDAACLIARELSYPVVVKPADLEQGKGVFANLKNEQSVKKAYGISKNFSSNILVEKHYDGEDYRLTVLHGKVIKVMHRRPGGLIGDGVLSVADLYKQFQESPENLEIVRREGKSRLLWDEEAEEMLETQQLTKASIPAKNRFVGLRRKNNISTGGSYQIIPIEKVHQDNIALAVRAATILRLDLAGIDLITKDIEVPWHECNGVICEVNSQPQIGIRNTPEIYQDILTELVPSNGMIPLHLCIVTNETETRWSDEGTANKLMMRLAEQLKCSALSNSSGGWVNGKRFLWRPASSFAAAKSLVLDPQVDSLLCVMRSRDVVKYGLPADQFETIRIVVTRIDDRRESVSNKLHRIRTMAAPHSKSLNVITENELRH